MGRWLFYRCWWCELFTTGLLAAVLRCPAMLLLSPSQGDSEVFPYVHIAHLCSDVLPPYRSATGLLSRLVLQKVQTWTKCNGSGHSRRKQDCSPWMYYSTWMPDRESLPFISIGVLVWRMGWKSFLASGFTSAHLMQGSEWVPQRLFWTDKKSMN